MPFIILHSLLVYIFDNFISINVDEDHVDADYFQQELQKKKKYYINQTPIAFQQTVMKNRFDNENSPNTRNLGTVVELSTMEKPIWD